MPAWPSAAAADRAGYSSTKCPSGSFTMTARAREPLGTAIGAPPFVTTGAPSCFSRPKMASMSRTSTISMNAPLSCSRRSIEPAVGLRDLDDLDAGAHAGGPADRPAQLRVGQAEHVAQRRVGVGVGRRALHVEAEPVAIEGERLVEVGDDRAEEVARADDEAGWCRSRWCRRRRCLCKSHRRQERACQSNREPFHRHLSRLKPSQPGARRAEARSLKPEA